MSMIFVVRIIRVLPGMLESFRNFARDAELFTGDPRWYIFLPRLSPLAFIFAGVKAGGALNRDV